MILEDIDITFLIQKSKKCHHGCLRWKGSHFINGYGRIKINQKFIGIHRIAYILYNNIKLEDIKNYILHRTICYHKDCIEPTHLYEGDASDNAFDLIAVGGHHEAIKTHCINGHEYTTRNTYYDGLNKRHCRTCRRKQSRNFEIKEKELKNERSKNSVNTTQ